MIDVSTLTTISLLNDLSIMASSDKYSTWYILITLWYYGIDKEHGYVVVVVIHTIEPGMIPPNNILWLLHILLPPIQTSEFPQLAICCYSKP